MCNRAAPDASRRCSVHTGCFNAAVSDRQLSQASRLLKDRIGNCGDDRRSPGLALRGELLILSPLCTSARDGLGGCPVCGPIAVAEDLFTRMRCELDHPPFARACLLFMTDIFGCDRALAQTNDPLLITAVVVAKSYVAPLSEDIDLK